MAMMSTPPLAPRSTLGGVIAVWIVAAVAGVSIGLFVPSEWRAAWLPLALGGCLILAFAVQLGYGRPHRFIQRVAASVVGALLILGVISLGFGLAAVVPG
tara:strand:+ start:312 stop:611 length:300 start_codon:yes stop_codon:yes gene_type:complete